MRIGIFVFCSFVLACLRQLPFPDDERSSKLRRIERTPGQINSLPFDLLVFVIYYVVNESEWIYDRMHGLPYISLVSKVFYQAQTSDLFRSLLIQQPHLAFLSMLQFPDRTSKEVLELGFQAGHQISFIEYERLVLSCRDMDTLVHLSGKVGRVISQGLLIKPLKFKDGFEDACIARYKNLFYTPDLTPSSEHEHFIRRTPRLSLVKMLFLEFAFTNGRRLSIHLLFADYVGKHWRDPFHKKWIKTFLEEYSMIASKTQYNRTAINHLIGIPIVLAACAGDRAFAEILPDGFFDGHLEVFKYWITERKVFKQLKAFFVDGCEEPKPVILEALAYAVDEHYLGSMGFHKDRIAAYLTKHHQYLMSNIKNLPYLGLLVLSKDDNPSLYEEKVHLHYSFLPKAFPNATNLYTPLSKSTNS